MSNHRSELAKILKQRRLVVALSLGQLARATSISSSHLARIETGERFPSASILRKIAKPLGFSEAELFMHAGYLSGQPSTEVKSEMSFGGLDPYVAKVLSEEPLEVQRAVISILSILKSLTKE